MKKGIVVLGMHRSGTSLVANLLHSWGAYAGDKQELLPGDKNNLQGYWEYIPLVRLNHELLASLSASWFVPPGEDCQKIMESKDALPEYRQRALRLINSMEQSGCHWVWKDPRVSLLLPFWKEIWGDVIYVIVVRHPLETAISLRKRDQFPLSASLLLWQKYMLAILSNTEDSASKIYIQYDKLLRQPREYCQRLYTFLERFCEGQADQDRGVEGMLKAVNLTLWHNQIESSFSDVDQATPDQKALYSFLMEKAEDASAPFDETRFTPYAGWREYLQTISALRHIWSQSRSKDRLPQLSLTLEHRKLFGL
jgi:hypothetical protein